MTKTLYVVGQLVDYVPDDREPSNERRPFRISRVVESATNEPPRYWISRETVDNDGTTGGRIELLTCGERDLRPWELRPPGEPA